MAHYHANHEYEPSTDYFTNEFRDTPGHTWPLTDLGREQVKVAGQWIVAEVLPNLINQKFDEGFTSPHVRCIQTASGLQIPNMLWNEPEPKLRERDWGDIESIPTSEYYNDKMFALNAIRRRGDYLNWSPPGGESMAEVMQRVEKFLCDIQNFANPKSYLLSAHGEVMTAERAIIEQVRTGYRLSRLKTRKEQKLDNASIIWYTDRHPVTDERSGRLEWYRIVNAYKEKDTGWKKIERQTYTNETLLTLLPQQR